MLVFPGIGGRELSVELGHMGDGSWDVTGKLVKSNG